MGKNKGFFSGPGRLCLAGIILAVFTSALSCENKEEKLYGKIDTKVKIEREMITKVQNSYFPINMNISLKEAVAANAFSSNIVWRAPYTDNKGNWGISVEYDIEPIDSALSIYAYDNKDLMDYVNRRQSLHIGGNVFKWDNGMIVSPYGYANFVTRFIQGEVQTPHISESREMKLELRDLLQSYMDFIIEEGYRYSDTFISGSRIPDTLPDPFFKVTAAKFIAVFAAEQVSDDVELIRYDVLLDIVCPYLDNREYKGIGIGAYEGVFMIGKETIGPEDALRFIYEDTYLWSFYYFINDICTAEELGLYMD
jgi:hypothetical protein